MTTITGIISNLQNIINLLVPLVFAIAFIVFIWGVFQYFIMGGANEEKRAQGRQLVMWGIIAFAIMVSVWGLVNVVTGTLNLGSNNRPCLPTFSGSTGCPGSTPAKDITNTDTGKSNSKNSQESVVYCSLSYGVVDLPLSDCLAQGGTEYK